MHAGKELRNTLSLEILQMSISVDFASMLVARDTKEVGVIVGGIPQLVICLIRVIVQGREELGSLSVFDECSIGILMRFSPGVDFVVLP